MRPKGKLFALFAVFAAIGLVTASGAFTTVQADRTATVNVAGDASALLQLQPADGANGAYATDNGGQLLLQFNSSADDGNGGSDVGDGVNEDAVTRFDNVFNVTNQGTQPITLQVSGTDSNDISYGEGQGPANLYLYNGTDHTEELDGSTTVGIDQGETRQVGVFINSSGLDNSSVDDQNVEITINATAS